MASDAKNNMYSIATIIFVSTFTVVYSQSFLASYLPEMVIWFGFMEVDKGYYVGIALSAYYFGSVVTCYLWCWLANRIGHRRVLMGLLTANGTLTLIFGFVHDYATTVFLQFCIGSCNAIMAIVRAILPIYLRDDQQALVMTLLNVGWECGLIGGSAGGGYLSSPLKKYPGVFSQDFFETFPYILPPLLAAIFSLLSAVITLFLFPDESAYFRLSESLTNSVDETVTVESNTVNDAKNLIKRDNLSACQKENICLADSLNKPTYSSCNYEDQQHSTNIPDCSNHDEKCTHKSNKQDSIPSEIETISGNNKLDGHINIEKMSKNNMCLPTPMTISECDIPIKESESVSFKGVYRWLVGLKHAISNTTLMTLLRNKHVMVTVSVYAILMYVVDVYAQIFATWASTIRPLGGLGYSTNDIGSIVTYTVGPCTILQLIFMPIIERKIGSVNTLIIYAMIGMTIISLIPLCRFITDPNTLYITLMIAQSLATTCELGYCISIGILTNNSYPKRYICSVNGLAWTLTYLGLTVYPVITGSIYAGSISSGIGSPIDASTVFVFMGWCVWVGGVIAYFIPRRFNHKYDEDDITKGNVQGIDANQD